MDKISYEMITKKYGERAKENLSYNIRRWMIAIQSPYFSQNLYYTDGKGTPCFNGNISSMTWKAGSETTVRGYKFTYDRLARIKNAAYGEGDNLSLNTNRFSEQVTGYDKQGNILGLSRYGQISETGYSLIDNLTLSYNGNQLKAVKDNATSTVYANGFEFKDGANAETEYTYDENGNLNKDLNKKITLIQYNCLNLPEKVQFEGGNSIAYTYAADGTKIRTTHTTGSNTVTTDYCDNAIYENGVLVKVLTEDGYITVKDAKPHYFIQDHQGNNRVIVDKDGKVEETNHYYPFGGLFANSTGVQPYKYNGKELDRANGLDWYDYGARQYDAAIGRWHVVDPMSEKYYCLSPYNYCNNEPIGRIDPNGKDYWSTNDRNQIFAFINALTNGNKQFDFSSWNHATDADFLADLVYNDEKKKFYSSYTEIINGEINIIGVSFDANIKPVTFSGIGYKGAFVYEPLDGFILKANHFLEGTKYFDGTFTWNVNLQGRITGIAPKIGFPPLLGKGFRGGKQYVRDSNMKQFPKEFKRWFHKYYKKDGDLDATTDELNDLYQEWIKMGQPKVK